MFPGVFVLRKARVYGSLFSVNNQFSEIRCLSKFMSGNFTSREKVLKKLFRFWRINTAIFKFIVQMLQRVQPLLSGALPQSLL